MGHGASSKQREKRGRGAEEEPLYSFPPLHPCFLISLIPNPQSPIYGLI
ncbi:hypothetical protein FDUTEX481_06832 [Tolypothrix sp. PCC 7601]|nr:hypothetical protein FDUTEX481_06832 [Tolypothrix sp. PCC 7601]